ncbi:hypothetical protein ACFFSY_07255 [Paenibacillus aurantiacus]|uniref:Lipoprotein n=1 Tax=Paenibacillus aurantiacus TaxID=1936118 RepID=A0ABV5KKG8_9BACL
MNKSKQLAAILMTAVLAVSLAACSNGGGNNTNTPPDSGSATNNEGTAPGNAGSVTDPAPADNPILQGTGKYNGAADSHTVEIETPDGPTAFQLGESIDPAILEQLEENDPVTFEYEEVAIEGDASSKQRVLTKIQKAEAAQGGAAGGVTRAETTKLTLEIEGMKEQKTAKLARGEGYSLYVFDELFDFDAKSGALSMKNFPDYKAEIVQLPADYKLDKLREEAQKALSATGEVRELKGDEINSTMRDADLFLLASSDKETKEVIVKDIDGIGYQFNVTMPAGEASEGFGPHAFASLNTIAKE